VVGERQCARGARQGQDFAHIGAAVDGAFVSTGKTYKNDSEFAGLARAVALFQD
jgi:hypothetical protein